MKKIICIIVITIITIITIGTISNANSATPEYDATFDNGKGIFYANGTPITIDKNSNGDTVVYWNGGEQIVSSTVRIIGGGKEGTNFSESNIIMEDGIVSHIYGGGKSIDENNLTVVDNVSIVINGGKVLQTVYGGGLLFTTTTTSNITINNGIIKSICGGGAASASIAGIPYSAGIETDLQNSKNRVEETTIIINGGKLETESSTYGSVFGGGQGYSYVETANLTINAGDLSNAYLIGGGSNGYTENSNMKISGGTIKVLQTVNRGEMKNATVRIDGGIITNAYIGGENDPSVTGKIDNVDFAILGGTITNLLPGVSSGNPIIVNQDNYKAILVEGKVENSEIGEEKIIIKYKFDIIEDMIRINKNENLIVDTKLVTEPVGYEYLFTNEKISWATIDPNIVTVNENGNITGISKGKTTVSANLLEIEDIVQIEVLDFSGLFLMIVIIFGIIALILWIYVILSSI